MGMLISFVILTWNSSQHIVRCVTSFARSIESEAFKAEFLIVDNGSRDDTLFKIRSEIKPKLPSCCTIETFRLRMNFGTTLSRNIALRSARGSILVICDADTEFKDGLWASAINYISDNNSIGILAPALFFANGDTQKSVKKFPTAYDKIAKVIKRFFKLPIGNGDFYSHLPYTVMPVDTAISACWIFKRELLHTVGYFDERIFYSPEDVDYCLRVWQSGKMVIYYPEMKVLHHTQQISHRKPFSRLAISHIISLGYYFAKHGYCFSTKRLERRLARSSTIPQCTSFVHSANRDRGAEADGLHIIR